MVLAGANVLVVAPTGSGKTEAAMLPVFSKLAGAREGRIKAVYVTPLRSLNRDIFQRLIELGRVLGVKVELRHGDSTSAEKKRFLRSPPHVMITTPESFYFLLSVKAFREAISELRYVIVDEVHEIFSSKRGAELSLALERVERLYTRRRLQVIGLSATVEKPHLFAKRLFSWRSFAVVEDTSRKRIEITVDSGEKPEETYNLIANYISKIDGKVIVFTNTRDTAEIVGARLKELLGENVVEVHHGSLSRDVRLRVEREFKKGNVKVVVATSSLELGIDIGDVDFVIQYMSPRQTVKLLQRVGRAGHGYNRVSKAAIISSPNIFDVLESAVIAARALRGNLEELPFYPKPFDALIHQIAGTVIENREISVTKLFDLVTTSYYYRDLSLEEFESVLQLMEYMRLIRRRGQDLVTPGPRLIKYYFSTTMIPDTKQYTVVDIETSQKIGVLDEEFVATLEKGDVFVLSGETWEVVSIDDFVRVRKRRHDSLLPPAWEGDLIPVEYKVAREVSAVLRRLRSSCGALMEYPVRRELAERVCDLIRETETVPGDDLVLIEHYRDVAVIYTFLGSRGNMALEYLLAGLLEEMMGYPPETTSTPYIVALKTGSAQVAHLINNLFNIIKSLDRKAVDEVVRRSVRRSRVFRWVLLHVALRSGAISKEADLKEVRRLLPALGGTILGIEAEREINTKKIDINILYKFIDELRSGKKKVIVKKKEGLSKLALEALGESRIPERLRTETVPSTLLSEIIKRKIARKQVTLVCMNCGYTVKTVIERLEERPRCPVCGSGMLAPVHSDEESRKLRNIVTKVRRRARLNRYERDMFKKYIDAASLVLDYGRKAIEALTYTGVGPSTARRVLRKLVFGEQQFYAALVEAEARYHKYKHKLRQRSS